jgi:hypothetical protein
MSVSPSSISRSIGASGSLFMRGCLVGYPAGSPCPSTEQWRARSPRRTAGSGSEGINRALPAGGGSHGNSPKARPEARLDRYRHQQALRTTRAGPRSPRSSTSANPLLPIAASSRQDRREARPWRSRRSPPVVTIHPCKGCQPARTMSCAAACRTSGKQCRPSADRKSPAMGRDHAGLGRSASTARRSSRRSCNRDGLSPSDEISVG